MIKTTQKKKNRTRKKKIKKGKEKQNRRFCRLILPKEIKRTTKRATSAKNANVAVRILATSGRVQNTVPRNAIIK
ncbi:MAG: hypothetical protein FQY80_09745 [Ornithobacterium rhinotracheale]|nr:hypothetical protein [Ornithobacterium rhinotracheale]